MIKILHCKFKPLSPLGWEIFDKNNNSELGPPIDAIIININHNMLCGSYKLQRLRWK